MHMFEIFKFEFVVWLDLNTIEKIKKGIRNSYLKEKPKAAQPPPSPGLSAQLGPARACPPPLSLYPVGSTYRRRSLRAHAPLSLSALWAYLVSVVTSSLRVPVPLRHGPALPAPYSPQPPLTRACTHVEKASHVAPPRSQLSFEPRSHPLSLPCLISPTLSPLALSRRHPSSMEKRTRRAIHPELQTLHRASSSIIPR
jgi:hypothetical protein